MNTFEGARQKWSQVFESQDLTIESLKERALSKTSNLGNDGIRSICWKVYLSYLPTVEISAWPALLTQERQGYDKLLSKFIRAVGSEEDTPDLEVNNPLSLAEDSPWQQFFVDSELKKIIHQDVERTFPDNDYFRSEKVQAQLNDILFIYCKINHDVSYRQGMHELLAYILWVVSVESLDVTSGTSNANVEPSLDIMKQVLDSNFVEHDSYVLFSNLMGSAKPWYEFSEEGFGQRRPQQVAGADQQPFARINAPEPSVKPTPVIVWSMRIFEHLKVIDRPLFQHLKSLEIQPQLFGIRWLRLLFGREFPMADSMILWDGIFSQDPSLEIAVFIGVALLVYIRDDLLEGDFAECLHKLMRYPEVKDISIFITQALYLRQHPNPVGGMAITRQNDLAAGKPVPPVFQNQTSDFDSTGQPQQRASSPLHSPLHHQDGPLKSPQFDHSQARNHNRQHSGLTNTTSNNNNLLPPGALDAIKPVAEGVVHVAKNVMGSKGGVALNRAIHDMKRNTQSYIRKASEPTPRAAESSFPPMFDQAISSTGRLATSHRPAPSPRPQHQQGQPQQKRATRSAIGQVVAKALAILESELSTKSNPDDASTSNNTPESKAVKSALLGLEHVRDVLLEHTLVFEPMIIDQQLLEGAKDHTFRTTPSPSTASESIPPPVPEKDDHRPKDVEAGQHHQTAVVTSKPSSSVGTVAIESRERRPKNAMFSTIGANTRSDGSSFTNHQSLSQQSLPYSSVFVTSGSESPPTPVTPVIVKAQSPKPTQPFSFDDLLGESDGDREVGGGSRVLESDIRVKSSLEIQNVAKVRSPKTRLANSQFSWMLNDKEGQGIVSGSGAGTGVGRKAATLGPSTLTSGHPGSGFHRIKVDPLAGNLARGGTGSTAGNDPSDEDPLRDLLG